MKYLSRSRAKRSAGQQAQRGFSLIEVLVTMLILSFGLIGVAGLLVKGVANASASESLTKANQLAADMADRIRANPAVALSATSEYLTNSGRGDSATWPATPAATPATIAQQDVKAWMDTLKVQLPNGEGRIENTVGGGQRKYLITVRWSNCAGTLSTQEKTDCLTNSTTAYRNIKFDLRL